MDRDKLGRFIKGIKSEKRILKDKYGYKYESNDVILEVKNC